MSSSTANTVSTFTASDGTPLYVQDWPLPAGRKATVLLVHGLGEHSGRYATLAQQLNAWGYAVRGYDQYGHGQSGGPRGGLNQPDRLLVDLASIVTATRAALPPQEKLILLGHSMGGLVAAAFVAQALAQEQQAVDGLVLSSPALDAGLNPVQRWLVGWLPAVLPDLRVGNGLQVRYLAHDAHTVQRYQQDRLCHNRISARLAQFIAHTGPATVAAAPRWRVPTLLLWAGQDHLVNPAGSRAFAAAAPAALVQAQEFADLYHEIFNETPQLAAPVYASLQAWLAQRFAG